MASAVVVVCNSDTYVLFDPAASIPGKIAQAVLVENYGVEAAPVFASDVGVYIERDAILGVVARGTAAVDRGQMWQPFA